MWTDPGDDTAGEGFQEELFSGLRILLCESDLGPAMSHTLHSSVLGIVVFGS